MYIKSEPKMRERLYFIEVIFILPKTHSINGVQVNIGYDLHVQQPIHDTSRAYWRYGVSLLSESSEIPPEVQHQFPGDLLILGVVHGLFYPKHPTGVQ